MRLTRCAKSMPSISPARRMSENSTTVSLPCWQSVAKAFSALSQEMTRISHSSSSTTATSRTDASSSTTTAIGGFTLPMVASLHSGAIGRKVARLKNQRRSAAEGSRQVLRCVCPSFASVLVTTLKRWAINRLLAPLMACQARLSMARCLQLSLRLEGVGHFGHRGSKRR